MTTENFQFAPDILRRLGEELIPHPEQGILELVRNAYDADARTCTVTLRDTSALGGMITVSDDGDGMTRADIRDGWLVLGKSRKTRRRRTSRLNRLTVGDKGLGRLAALRLGDRATLATRPAQEPGVEYRLSLDWAAFDDARVVEDVQLEVSRHATNKTKGTDIEIAGLSRILGEREVLRLARSLLLLADPFDSRAGFRPTLKVPEFRELERLVKRGYFDEADYHLVAELDGDGYASARVLDWKGNVLFHADHAAIASHDPSLPRRRGRRRREAAATTTAAVATREGGGTSAASTHVAASRAARSHNGSEVIDLGDGRFEAPAARFELWTFLLRQEPFHLRTATVTELRQWLEAVGGVHLYHRGLRVLPYGDPGFDWLDMNLARAASPEERPSTNNSLGRVVVLDPDEQLLQKTDRTGFVENEAFDELRRFAQSALE